MGSHRPSSARDPPPGRSWARPAPTPAHRSLRESAREPPLSRPHPSLSLTAPGAKMAAAPPPHPRIRTTQLAGPPARIPEPRSLAKPARPASRSPPQPSGRRPPPSVTRVPSAPDRSGLRQSDVTHRTPPSCEQEPRAPPPPGPSRRGAHR
ncbi:hypothetical protein P7K49_022774 [Saguinus oedipus]|uniref:Uncharacterized protein n=1 Tax=Saguinus oedipus TaxID=9490 RepID=A0ABQ9UJS0_SAGOE|nr:hypothetical protein P7K49_022774 [Saguinus oedipus]